MDSERIQALAQIKHNHWKLDELERRIKMKDRQENRCPHCGSDPMDEGHYECGTVVQPPYVHDGSVRRGAVLLDPMCRVIREMDQWRKYAEELEGRLGIRGSFALALAAEKKESANQAAVF